MNTSTKPSPTNGAAPRIWRLTVSCLALGILAITFTGCAISTTYGKRPVPVSGSPDTYQITIFKNPYESHAGADRTAEKEIRSLLAETDCNDYEISRIDRAQFSDVVNKDVYTVKVFRSASPRQVAIAERVGELTAEVLLHIDLPGAGVKIVNTDTDKTFATRADKNGWVFLELPRGRFLFGEVEKSEYQETKTHMLRSRLEVQRTDGILYVGHVYVNQGGLISNEIEQARLMLKETAHGEKPLHEGLLQQME